MRTGDGDHRAGLADLLRRRARLGALRADGATGAAAVGRRCSRPVRRTARVPVGIGVYATTGRIEKGYRAFGYELDGERTIVEAGMQRPKVKTADFVGREAYLAQREAAPETVLCTLTVDDHTSASGVKRYMLGGEPILTRDGGTLDRRARPPPLRHHAPGRRRRSASTCCSPTCRRPRPRSATSSRCPTWRSSTRSPSAPSTARRSSTRANERIRCMTNVLVCIKRVPDLGGEITPDRRRHGRRRLGRSGHTVSPHEECAVELAIQVGQGHRRPGDRADARLRRTRSSSCGTRWRSGCTGAVLVEADAACLRPGRRRRGDRRRGAGARGGRDDVRPRAAGQRRLRHRRLPGRHPAVVPPRPAGRRRRLDAVRRRRHGRRARRRPGRRHRDLRGPAARGRSPSWRAASSRATRRSRAG